jgi:tetratricopeptide (TPR) repeat protein
MAIVAGFAIAVIPAVVSAHVGPEALLVEAREAVQRQPDDPQARLQHARALHLAHHWTAALSELDAAAARGADPHDVGAARAAILFDSGRAPESLRELDRILALRPDASVLIFERGRVLLALGRTDEATDELGRAIAAMPAPRPEHVIARRDALLSLGRREEAVTALDEGMSRVGRVASLQLPAIDLEVELGRYESALHRLDELLARSDRNPAWIARRGAILEKAGRTAEARAEYERALAIIDTRSKARRAKAFDDLKRRLETELASASHGETNK